MINVLIIGGSGYVGGELLKFLLFHPDVKIIGVTSQSHVGKKVSDIHPNLKNVTQLQFQQEDIEKLSKKADVVFLALPAGASMKKIKDINLKKTKVIDLGPDFRLKDASNFEEVYKMSHDATDLLKQAVCGIPEIYKEQIKKAQLVACPGCFPTGATLALYPLAKAKLLSKNVIVDSKTGSSGSGIKPSEATHHPERANDFKAYQVFSHRHLPEIIQVVNDIQGEDIDLIFTPHSAPMVRGIFTTAYIFLKEEISHEKMKKIYLETYKNSPFIRLVDQSRTAVVAGSNYCDIAFYVKGNKLIVTSAIDNLVKGAAGQAIQNMNIMFGLPEITGLQFPGLHP